MPDWPRNNQSETEVSGGAAFSSIYGSSSLDSSPIINQRSWTRWLDGPLLKIGDCVSPHLAIYGAQAEGKMPSAGRIRVSRKGRETPSFNSALVPRTPLSHRRHWALSSTARQGKDPRESHYWFLESVKIWAFPWAHGTGKIHRPGEGPVSGNLFRLCWDN